MSKPTFSCRKCELNSSLCGFICLVEPRTGPTLPVSGSVQPPDLLQVHTLALRLFWCQNCRVESNQTRASRANGLAGNGFGARRRVGSSPNTEPARLLGNAAACRRCAQSGMKSGQGPTVSGRHAAESCECRTLKLLRRPTAVSSTVM